MFNRDRARTIFFCTAIILVGLCLAPAVMHGQAGISQGRSVAVGPQYDSTHVYIAPNDFDAFVNSFVATFGGKPSKRIVGNVLPVPSSAYLQFVMTPAGGISIFAFQTPIPFPFGQERTGYLVTDMDEAIKAARAAGAEVIVEPFTDPIGRDALIQWPGGVKMQLYWHFTPSTSPSLETIPDNRVYVSRDQVDNFVRSFLLFSDGKVVADDRNADAGEIGRPNETYRRIRITSRFGNMQVLVTDGHLPYPFGHELTGYEVKDLGVTLEKAKATGGKVLSAPYHASDRTGAIVEFPGGYIAEIHGMASH
jgi:predicted enzyme related to lactoylglutathione lyase